MPKRDDTGSRKDTSGPVPGAKPVLKLRHFLPYQLSDLAETVSRSLSGIYAEEFGIGIPEWRVLATLGEISAMTARDVGQATSMHKTKVSRAVAALKKRDLILRETNPADQRELVLRLTAAGQALYEEIVPRALAYSAALENALTEDQRALLPDLFDRLHRAAGGRRGA
ncbi:MarR family winged helix-turn-helix transcriptional regulator [Roseibium sp. AS2]|uniref:MarR family winged helix-turn-helix transcriptional regulator n=1 Tax=Roseibium sp. AS2 TaxID=3135781 RepID=UPI00317167A7